MSLREGVNSESKKELQPIDAEEESSMILVVEEWLFISFPILVIFFKGLFFILCMCMFCLYACLCSTCLNCSQRGEEKVKSRTRIIDGGGHSVGAGS